ncbi:MAG: hypothetical protein ACLRFL_01860 [Clostridia bacterium]
MKKSKKAFLITGAIISILVVLFMMFISFGLSLINMMVNEDFILDTYLEDPYYEVVEDTDGSYIIYDQDGILEMTSDDLKVIVNIVKGIINTFNFMNMASITFTMIFAIRILIKVSKGKNCEGSTIALLVLSIIQWNILTLVLMIVALCVKDESTEEKDIQLPTENITYTT